MPRVPEQQTPIRWRLWALAAVGVGVVAWSYWPGLAAGFYFDDLPNIVDVPALHWEGPTWREVREGLTGARLTRRAVANLTFGLNHAWGGLEPRGYHLANLAIHLLVGLALGWVAWLYGCASSRQGSGRPWAAAGAATLLFLLHPLNVQSVTYVVQRMSSLAALFSLLAFGAYLRGRGAPAGVRRWWWGGALMSWLLAVGSKETALVLPAVAIAYELSVDGATWRARWMAWRSRRGRWVLVVGAAGLGVTAWLLWQLYSDAGNVRWLEHLPGREYTGWERVLTQGRVQLFYLILLAWPAPGRLNLDHDFAISTSWLEPATLAALLFWLAAGVAVAWLASRRPFYGFPLLAYLLLHALESGPVNLELVFEHRMYLPMAFLALLVSATLARSSRRRRRLLMVSALLLALPLAVATRARNLTWADPITLHEDCARKAPEKPRTRNNLGSVLAQAGRHRQAIGEFEAALSRRSDYLEARVGLGKSLAAVSRFAEAEAALRRAATGWPAEPMPRIELGNLYRLQQRSLEAVAEYRAALAVEPQSLGAAYNLGSLLVELGAPGEAISLLESVRQRHRSFAALYRPLGDAYRLLGQGERAIARYREGLERGVDGPELRLALGTALGEAGRLAAARRHLERALALGARSSEAHNNLGIVYLQTGDAVAAVARFQEAVELDPGNGRAHFNLSIALRQLGRTPEADAALERARSLGIAAR